MVRKQKLLGQINKVRTLAEGVGRFQEANGNLFHIIDGQWVSGQKLLTFLFFRVKKVTQLALQELNLISQFNFNLVLPDIIANEKALCQVNLFSNHMYQSHLPLHLALVI